MQNTHKDLQDSGLHNTPFYITRYFSRYFQEVTWNRELHIEYGIDEDDLIDLTEDEIDNVVTTDFYEAIEMYNYYRQVEQCDYNEEDAYKCNLIPFRYFDGDANEDIYLLALGGCGMDLSPKYDAYFFLQTGNMDPASTYFRDKDYFKSLVSTEIFNAIEEKFGGVTVWDLKLK